MMLRKLGTWAVVLGLTLPVWAGDRPGAISGYVRSTSGVPQMGAVVEILGSAAYPERIRSRRVRDLSDSSSSTGRSTRWRK